MSEAMTNSEIEDVLTSIRRLVALEGTRPADSGRLILTEELRVGAAVTAAIDALEAASEQAEEDTPPPAAGSTEADHFGADEPVAGAVADASFPEPDFGKLEATIAELEAAVSASGETWEADAPVDEAPRPSNVTDLYGRLSFSRRAEPTDDEDVDAPVDQTDPAPTIDESAAIDPVETAAAAGPGATIDDGFDPQTTAAPIDEEILDEDMLRALVAQIVREELHGQLGERVTQQVRKLVRAEIAKALDERKFL